MVMVAMMTLGRGGGAAGCVALLGCVSQRRGKMGNGTADEEIASERIGNGGVGGERRCIL